MNSKISRLYCIGGYIFHIIGPEFDENDYLSCFRVDNGIPDMTINITIEPNLQIPADIEPIPRFNTCDIDGIRYVFNDSGSAILMKIHKQNNHLTQVFLSEYGAGFLGTNMIIRILDLPTQFLKRSSVFLHASFIAYEGGAILFTAPKQTGKSTQAALWEKYRGADVINGDRALLVYRENQWYACGSPYCGTSKICHNQSLPIRAIAAISQGKENQIRRATVREALSALLDGCSYDVSDREQVSAIMEIASKIISSVPIFKLQCTPDEEAIKALEGVL